MAGPGGRPRARGGGAAAGPPSSSLLLLPLLAEASSPEELLPAAVPLSPAPQVMGSGGEFLVTHRQDPSRFWAETERMAFGGCYQDRAASEDHAAPRPESEFEAAVGQGFLGFQASDILHEGAVEAVAPDGDMLAGDRPLPPSTLASARWSYAMQPIYGWGGAVVDRPGEAAAAGDGPGAGGEVRGEQDQKSTTGWMAASRIFDPQRQISVAHALAEGWVELDGKREAFSAAPTYIEK